MRSKALLVQAVETIWDQTRKSFAYDPSDPDGWVAMHTAAAYADALAGWEHGQPL